MATLRRQSDSRDPREVVRVPLRLVTGEADRDEFRTLTPEQRRTLAAIEREIAEASMGGPFDLRRALSLDTAAKRTWFEGRAVWMRERLAGDPRVEFDRRTR